MSDYEIFFDYDKPDMEVDGHKFWKVYERGNFKVVRHEYPDGAVDYLTTVKGAKGWIAGDASMESACLWVDVNCQMGLCKWDEKRHRLCKGGKRG